MSKKITAGEIADFFGLMQKKGLLHSKDEHSQSRVNQFDVDMFALLSIDLKWNGKSTHYECVHRAFDELFDSGADFDWIRSPHAETIFRAMAVRKNHLPSVAHLCQKV